MALLALFFLSLDAEIGNSYQSELVTMYKSQVERIEKVARRQTGSRSISRRSCFRS